MKEFDAWMGQEETKDRLPTNKQYRCEKGGLVGYASRQGICALRDAIGSLEVP